MQSKKNQPYADKLPAGLPPFCPPRERGKVKKKEEVLGRGTQQASHRQPTARKSASKPLKDHGSV